MSQLVFLVFSGFLVLTGAQVLPHKVNESECDLDKLDHSFQIIGTLGDKEFYAPKTLEDAKVTL